MAFNSRTFRTRTITAAVFVVIMLAGLLWNRWSFLVLFSLIHFGCWIEYQKLVGLIDKGYQQITAFYKYGVMLVGWCLMLWFCGDAYKIFGLQLHVLGGWAGLILVVILPITELLFTKRIQLKNIGHSVFGLVYISLSWGLMMLLYQTIDIHFHDSMFVFNEKFIPNTIVISLWINDTMAYIVGSLIGKNSLSKISPKKTWEGTVGGIVLCILVMSFAFPKLFYSNNNMSISLFVGIIAAIAAIAGTFGDLLESKLKRMANVKDSGTLMPGHGGFLDRFDSMLLAVPFVWLFVYFFVK